MAVLHFFLVNSSLIYILFSLVKTHQAVNSHNLLPIWLLENGGTTVQSSNVQHRWGVLWFNWSTGLLYIISYFRKSWKMLRCRVSLIESFLSKEGSRSYKRNKEQNDSWRFVKIKNFLPVIWCYRNFFSLKFRILF